MTKKTIIDTDSGFENAKARVLNFANRFSTFCFLDNHQYQLHPHTEECLLAAGIKREIKGSGQNSLEKLQQFISNRSSWLFGHLSYDLKNQIESLGSDHADHIGFPDCYFFEPEIIIRLSREQLIIEADNAEEIGKKIFNSIVAPFRGVGRPGCKTQARFSKEDYIETIKKLKDHILRGDCYEINFCQEFFSENAIIDPLNIYQQLSDLSPNPFSALYKSDDKWLICASPERFLRKEGNRILSQ